MSNSPYSNEALAMYLKLIQATVSYDLEGVKELLKDESIDIQTLIPAEDDNLTSAVALAIDSGSEEMIQVFLDSPKMDFQHCIGQFNIKTVHSWKNMEFSSEESLHFFNVITYALFKRNFKLAEDLIKEGKCHWTGNDIVLAAHIYLENAQTQKFMEIIVIPNTESMKNLSKIDKIRLLNLFQYFKVDFEEIFDICFSSIEEDYDFEFWEWFYTFNIAKEWFEKLKRKDMLKNLNVLDENGRTLIMNVVKHSLEKAKILYDFGADIHLNGNCSLICEASENVTEFLQIFPFTEDDLLSVFKAETKADKVKIVRGILEVYPHYTRLVTLENVVLNPLEGSFEADLSLCLHYREELGLKADSLVWLQILTQIRIEPNLYQVSVFSTNFDKIRNAYGQVFNNFIESNKVKLLHLMVEKGRSDLARCLASKFNISWNALDESGNSAFLKLLTNPQMDGYYSGHDIDVWSIEVPTNYGQNAFLHHPKLAFSNFSLHLIRDVCKRHKIDMFEPNPITGETLLDRALKDEHLSGAAGVALLMSLESFKRVLTESEAMTLFTKCPYQFVSALILQKKILPSNIWELRDQVSGELLLERIIKSGVTFSGNFIIDDEERFYPHMELFATMGNNPRADAVFWEVMQKTNSENYLNLLKKDSIRSKYSDGKILSYALESEKVKLLQFAIEELGISPNTLIDHEFPLRRLILNSYTDAKGQLFNYLVEKGAIACIEPIKCAFLHVYASKWIEKLVQVGYDLTPKSVQIIKEKLYKSVEDNRASQLRGSDLEIISHSLLTHHFSVRDKSIGMLRTLGWGKWWSSFKLVGADPRCIINSKGETLLHLLKRISFPKPDFFTAFNITEEDLLSNGQASYSPISRILELYADDLSQCPIFSLYPRLFYVKTPNVKPYHEAKQDTILGDSSMCIICREEYLDTDEVIVGDCQHVMHFECFIRLDSSKCPVCRKRMKV